MKRFFSDLKKYSSYVIYAGQAELRAEIADSHLNWLWWIIEPFCFMLVYTFVFGYVFGAAEDYYPVFIFIGITMWDFFNRMLTDSVKIVKNNKPIVAKVYLPKYMLILIKAYVNLFKMTISFAIVLLMIVYYKVPITLNFLWVFPLVIAMVVVTFGICTFLLHFGVYVEDLSNVLRIFLRLMFYATGVFYNVETRVGKRFGAEVGRILTEWNPMAVMMSSMRRVLLYQELPQYKWVAAWFIAGIVISILGIRLIYKNENSYIKVV